jgi:hypothetical protein
MERKLTEILLNWTNAGYFCDVHACFSTATSRCGEDVSLKDRACEGGCCHEAQNANKPICPYSKRRPTQGLRNLNFLPQAKSAAGIMGQPQILAWNSSRKHDQNTEEDVCSFWDSQL